MIDGALPRDHVCIVPHDIDRDGKIDFAIGVGWPQNGGSIYWLRRGESLDEPWQIYEIGAEAWLLASIEPMHGNQVVVYPATVGDSININERIVLTESFNKGYALAFANLFGSGVPELVAGFRQPRTGQPNENQITAENQSPGPGIMIYQAEDQSLKTWRPYELDLENMACEDLLCHDFDGDGKIDIVAGGRASRNVRLYINQSSGD